MLSAALAGLGLVSSSSVVWGQAKRPAAAPAADAPDAKPAAQADVPVKVVVLFSSGVGYFEHFGTVKGNDSTELRFKTQQINDVLKSLVLQDLDGGKVSTITYPSQDPVEKTLRSFQVDITGNPSFAELLNQLRGAKVTLTTEKQEQVTGTILGVEKRQEPAGGGKDAAAIKEPPVPPPPANVVDVWVLNLISEGGIRSVRLGDVRNLQFQDPELRNELEKALTALAQARDKDKKPVQIHFRGQGNRNVRIGYVVETPIWKTSYRLILSDDKAGAGGDAGKEVKPAKAADDADPVKPKNAAAAGGGNSKLQGWAIVENQTDSDWNDVQLSLVSGRPISFIQDLYQPLYIPRPIVQPELYASLRPQTYDAGLGGPGAGAVPFADAQQPPMAPAAPAPLAEAKQLQNQFARKAGEKRRGEQLEKAKEASDDRFNAPMDAAASVASVASATDVGELFQYTVGNVSLPRQKSAMIPIIADAITTERLSIYNRNVLAKNPLNGARLKNTSGKHLLQGPITVLENGTYAGDAKIDDVPPGQERLVSFGIDQQLRVDADSGKQENAIQTGKIVKGVLQVTWKDSFTQEYVAQNKGEKDKTLLIEHPKRQGWHLTDDTKKPIETTEVLYRFQGASPAGKQTKLTVVEENTRVEGIAILPADVGQLAFYFRNGQIPQPVRDAITKAATMKQAMNETVHQIQLRQQEINTITVEQQRIRENIKTVQPNTDYYKRLTTKLNEQETRIEKLRAEIDTLQETQEKQRKELEGYLGELNVG